VFQPWALKLMVYIAEQSMMHISLFESHILNKPATNNLLQWNEKCLVSGAASDTPLLVVIDWSVLDIIGVSLICILVPPLAV
jgi:hypothetical protein